MSSREPASERRVRLVIRGRVQGVAYRAATRSRARDLELSGWVRNRSDGSVEAFVAGAPDRVERLIEWCRRGPPLARVESVDVLEVESGSSDVDLASGSGFEIRYGS